jgi:hypothetical protein
MQEKSHTWIYVTLAVVIVALMVTGVALYREQKQTAEARAKAQEFITKMHAAGLRAPKEDVVVRLFGTDGGVFAKSSDNALARAQYVWGLGTSGTASRPVILDPDFLKAAEIFVEVYAPEKLDDFHEFVNGLKTGETQ